MGREALSTEVWLQGTCSDVQLHRLSYLRPRRARAGGQRELSVFSFLILQFSNFVVWVFNLLDGLGFLKNGCDFDLS